MRVWILYAKRVQSGCNSTLAGTVVVICVVDSLVASSNCVHLMALNEDLWIQPGCRVNFCTLKSAKDYLLWVWLRRVSSSCNRCTDASLVEIRKAGERLCKDLR